MKDQQFDGVRIDLAVAAVKEQHEVQRKRIRLFGRAVLWQAFTLIAAGFLVFLAPKDLYMSRSFVRIYLGQSVINGLLGIVLLLLYIGIRRQNILCGPGAVLTCVTAMACSPLLRVAYGQAGFYAGGGVLSMAPVFAFILIYLLPFSILVIQLPAFLRWKKLKERYQDEMNHEEESFFQPQAWKPGPGMLLWLVLLAAGAGVCAYDETDYRKAWDISSWERFQLPGTKVSMNLPPENMDETQGEGAYMVSAGGDRFLVTVYYMNASEPDDSEEDERDYISIEPLSEPVDGIIGGIEYHQTAVRQRQFGAVMDIYTRTFTTEGRRYMCAVMVYGRTDRKVDETVEKIFDTIRVDG